MAAVLELKANGVASAVLKDGVPLTLQVSITSSDATLVNLGAPLSPWWEKVAVYGADGRQLFWPFDVLARRPASNEVILSPGDVAELELGCAPEELETVRVGNYEVNVHLSAPGGSALATSNNVRIDIVGQPLSDGEAGDPAHLATMATFLTKRGRYIEARAAIDKLVSTEGATAPHLLQMAALQDQLGDTAGAIQTYEHAEARYWKDNPDAYEGPEIIATHILRLRRAAT